MAGDVRVMIEPGTKGKRVVAVAFDWPGWERNGKSEEGALEALERYRARYRQVAALAGFADEFDAAGPLLIVERAEGSTSPDFGISGKSASAELGTMSSPLLERKLALLQACWCYFDETHPRISPILRKGPRGGGRDRDQIVRHTYLAETEYCRKVGVRTTEEGMATQEGRDDHRKAFLEGIRRVNEGAPMKSTWSLQFTIRRACYHMLDHAWELEDKDLTQADQM